MHVLRHLVRDAPEEFADEVVEIVAAFMLQPHLDPERNELREFTVAALTARTYTTWSRGISSSTSSTAGG